MGQEKPKNIGETVYDPGNVTIHACRLNHTDKDDKKVVINLAGGLDEFTVSYNLNKQSATCKITVLDTEDRLADIDIDGSETVELSFSSEGDDVISEEFVIFRKALSIDDSSGAKGKAYTLFGVDVGMIKQMTMDINRSFTGQISDFVKTIFKEINLEKEIEVHDTAGMSSLIIPGESPYDAIHRLESFGFSPDHQSSLYKFYQSKKGYNFKNVERIIAEERDDPHMYRYSPTELAENSKTLLAKHSIVRIDFPETSSLISKIKHGTHASSVAEIDIINQRINVTEFNIADDFKNFYHLDQPAISGEKKKVINDTLNINNSTTWINQYFDGQRHLNYNFGAQLPKREYYGSALDENQMNCTIHGNSSIDVGEVLYLSMLERTSNLESPDQEKRISGNYLISSVTHIVKSFRYACLLGCNKESARANVIEPENYIIGDR